MTLVSLMISKGDSKVLVVYVPSRVTRERKVDSTRCLSLAAPLPISPKRKKALPSSSLSEGFGVSDDLQCQSKVWHCLFIAMSQR